MTLRVLTASLATSLFATCTGEPTPEAQKTEATVAPAAVDVPAPTDALHEVTLATNPSGARVLLEGAEIGTTPYVLKYKRPTLVQLSLPGHHDETVTVDAQSEPHVIVSLRPNPEANSEAELEATPMPEVAEPKKRRATRAKTGSKSATPASTQAPLEPAKPAAKSSGLAYPNVAAAKSDYQAGKITRDTYDQAVRQLKSRRAAKIQVIRAQYQAGKIDKGEYNRRKRIIDNEYRGT